MQFLATLIGNLFTQFFAKLAIKWGLQEAIGAAFITVYLLLIASTTAAANLCLGSGGVCGAYAGSWTGLSEWLLFGLSLIPWEVVNVCACLVSLHASMWCAVVLARILRVKAGMNSRGLVPL